MHISKAFRTVNQELLIAKLYACGFDKGSLKMPWSYLTNRRQWIKIDTAFNF